MSGKSKLLSDFELFRGNGGGIEGWFTERMPDTVVDVLLNCENRPISNEVLNQLLILSHEGGMSREFFQFYFLYDPHPDDFSWYDPKRLPEFDSRFLSASELLSLGHLKWGLRRLYIDALLCFGNIRQAYRSLRVLRSRAQIAYRTSKCAFNTKEMTQRGSGLPLEAIARDDRYLISENACKTYEPLDDSKPFLIDFMRDRYRQLAATSKKVITVKELISTVTPRDGYTSEQLSLSLDEVLDREIETEDEINAAIKPLEAKFQSARTRALANTSLYLSMISDLDIYVATSMRSRQDFRDMVEFCETVFRDQGLAELKLRYFDPTMSAASSHEDKGLIECLMVKCAKVLIHNVGARDSFGKAVEAAMAMSLGKPVIFFCDEEGRHAFYHDVHPLSRLITFETGVPVGAMVTDNRLHVVELLSRIFRNEMEFELVKKKDDYFLLKEKLTNSTIRLQTDDLLLRETFWNYYNRE